MKGDYDTISDSFKKWWNNEDEAEEAYKKYHPKKFSTKITPMPTVTTDPAVKSNPVKPIETLENKEIFVIKYSNAVLAYLWSNFKENEDWRNLGNNTLMVKSHVMSMLQLKFAGAENE